jgi:acetyltransferase-like isoleucine patch superfamily enzyme
MADDMIKNSIRWTKALRSLLKTIWFNFYYLPFKQAIKLPILLYKPKLLRCKGSITLKGNVRFGMVHLGFYIIPNFPNNGIVWNVRGNVVFDNYCIIGNDSVIDVGEKGTLTFGDNFVTSASVKINCYKEITFGHHVGLSWGCSFLDTDFHQVKIDNSDGTTTTSKGFAKIKIGNYNWIAMNTTIMKGTKTPDYCIVGANSTLLKDYSALPQKCFIVGNPAILKKENIYVKLQDDEMNNED